MNNIRLITIVLILLLVSCVNKDSKSFQETSFSNLFFEIGDSIHFADSCRFVFECDCCFGNLIFENDSAFKEVAYCLEKVEVLNGLYERRNDSLILYYNGIGDEEVQNIHTDLEDTSNIFRHFQYQFEPFTHVFKIETCANKIMLRCTSNERLAIQSN